MKLTFAATARLALLALACTFAGCKTADTAHDGSLASVVINGHTAAEVRQTTIEVFGWNGYKQGPDLTFEKKGTKWDVATYGSWISDSLWIKVRVQITSRGELWQVLGCDAYIVENRGEGFLQDERKLKYMRADECKKILDQIQRRLALPKAEPS
jgi:hypothetical protein